MSLLGLPLDILTFLPAYFDNLRTLIQLQATCRALYAALERISPRTILALAVRSDFKQSKAWGSRPWVHTLALAVAGQVSDWAVGDLARTTRLQGAFQHGSRGILMLALEVAGLTLADLRDLCVDDSSSNSGPGPYMENYSSPAGGHA
ncbi:uncharacterized protein B0I36DRAFT_355038 [Microdochium trichocladiopsis]|uniref:F-box domain-containing protein n=1 Tax=Microdochium trichocladiopsis TaxID=1682393 RepID=A0A9P8XSP7_9PEZI|nr:uncharacterized protein B0I36DRAFT_355038 [Microdochium trichocladiopsis]KAH7016198.1 hypothetical protein B0I36DRAFT_355038 [Microdochium trichocladiopsis]